MKRKIFLFLAITAIATVLMSCSVTERCPAYADNEINSEQNS